MIKNTRKPLKYKNKIIYENETLSWQKKIFINKEKCFEELLNTGSLYVTKITTREEVTIIEKKT
jgi:hypothetical protein